MIRADGSHSLLLCDLARQTFIESHGHSAPAEDIALYMAEKYSPDVFQKELRDPQNLYHLLYHHDKAAGFSKIILNTPYSGSGPQHIAKLERIYLLKEFYGLGSALFKFNVDLAKEHGQQGIWLYVWTENHRAVSFYKKNGFQIIGNYGFKISENHSNPNHIMFLSFI